MAKRNKPRVFVVHACVELRITVNEPAVLDGARNKSFMPAWKEEKEVLRHMAFNRIANGLTEVKNLDGFADMPEGAARTELEDFDVEDIREVRQ